MLCYLTEVVVTSTIFLTDKNCQTWYSRPIVLLYLSIEHRERPDQYNVHLWVYPLQLFSF